MMKFTTGLAICLLMGITQTSPASAGGLCKGFGPQTPRDISSAKGANARVFTLATSSSKMNLCNIHTHTNAEHNGPGFSVTVSMAVTNARKPSR